LQWSDGERVLQDLLFAVIAVRSRAPVAPDVRPLKSLPPSKREEKRVSFIELQHSNGIATLTLNRGKVNAINGPVVGQLRETLESLERDPDTRAVLLTGAGQFFSFGFDIPEFLAFSREQFTEFVTGFTDLYTYAFLYPKPIVAALNGHTIAGGCMLALACDYRIMVSGKAKIALNEISFGSSVFAGSAEMLRFWVGPNATSILVSGGMYPAGEALSLGLVNEITDTDELMKRAAEVASALASKYQPAYASIKSLLRSGIANAMRSQERESIEAFVEIWYSESTWANLKQIKIY
jgi:3,2-trans-enoyl-CoA isomerase